MKRFEFPLAIRLAIIRRAQDSSDAIHCEQCGKRVAKGFYQIDHIVSEGVVRRKRELKPTDGRLLCLDCHAAKTARDADILAKAKRLAGVQDELVGRSEIARRYSIEQEDPPHD